MMQEIEGCNNSGSYFSKKAFAAIKSNLAGLPSFCRLTIYELLDYCDFSSGIISISTLDEVVRNDFYVSPAPGRKKEVINSDTLRNVFRTIKKARPEHFKFTTKNQRIIIEMPFLRDLYQRFFGEKEEVSTVVSPEPSTNKILSAIDLSVDLDALFLGEDVPEVAAATSRVREDINNKQQTTTKNTSQSPLQKMPISEDFVPDQNTIAEALARGYQTATNPTEIQAFIDHNKATGSLWADYNPIYLRWLARGKERKQQTKAQKIHSGRAHHESRNDRQTTKLSPRERVIQAYSRRFDFDETAQCFVHKPNRTNGHGEHVMAAAY